MPTPINIDLDLLQYKDQIDTKQADGKTYIYDPIRRKWIVLVPEEFVRQLIIQYLFEKAALNKKLLSVEKQIKVNGVTKRFDILLYDNNANPYLLVECKAPNIKLTNKTFDQISLYNMSLRVPLMLISNGRDNYFCKVDWENKSYTFESEVFLFNS